MGFTIANDTQRTVILGATGSGKTHAAMWHLSQRDFDRKPWIIYDYKGDDFINSLPGIVELDLRQVPTAPGLYVVHPIPENDDAMVQAQMWEIWQRGNTGIYIDEGYLISRKNRAFRMLLVQGRSKRIPMITLVQRPVWIDRFTLSEAEYYQMFRLQSKKDIDKVEEYIPHDLSQKLQPRESYYYSVPDDSLRIMGPMPDREVIKGLFRQRMQRIQRAM
jgi:hypothetical protein